MQTYTIKEDIRVLCQLVPGFPAGIKKALDSLVARFGHEGREYYGISYMDEQCRIVYKAAVSAADSEEAKYDYEPFTIQKGEYLSELLTGWMAKTDQIKSVFGRRWKNPVLTILIPASNGIRTIMKCAAW